MNPRKFLTVLLSLFALLAGGLAQADDVVKTVYHFSDGVEQAAHGLANIRNQLVADPTAKIVVVANGAGINFLLQGADDKYNFPATVQALAAKGVEFRVCNNTLVAGKIDKSRLLPQAAIIPAAVAELARLQAKEGYAYIKP